MISGSSNPPPSIREYYKKSHAIIIGISNYKEETSLPNAYNDASAIKRVLAEKYEFDHIITLFNEEATGEKIRDLLEDTLRDESVIGPQDRVLIYYSGHGKLRSRINWGGEEISTGYIIPYDSRLGRFGSSIEMDYLIKSCQECNAKHIFLILDCCYSGFAATRDAEPKVPPKKINRNFLHDITQRKAIQVLAATQKDEPANDSGILPGFSAFTGALLGILKNEVDPIPNGIITAGEIGAVLQQEVVNQKGVFQRPSYNVIAGSEGGDFIFKVLPERAEEEKPWDGLYYFQQSEEESEKKRQKQLNPKILIPIVAVVIGAVVAIVVFGGGVIHQQPSSHGPPPVTLNPPSLTNNTNHPPTAINESVTTDINKAIDITLVGNDLDKNDNLTAAIVTAPAHGTLGTINQNTGVVTYSPDPGFIGSDSFSFKTNDGKVDSKNIGTVNVRVKSPLPTALNQSMTTNENTPVNIILAGSDPNQNATLSAAIVRNPSHGTLGNINENTGIVTYTPKQGFTGNDNFGFKVNDGKVDSKNIGTVNVRVNAAR